MTRTMTLNEKLRAQLECLNRNRRDFTYAFDEAAGCALIVSHHCGDVLAPILDEIAGDLSCFITRENKAIFRIVTP